MLRLCLDILLLSIVSSIVISCNEKTVPGGRITVRNDILDKSYNAFTVDRVVTSKGFSTYKKTLKPNEQITIPLKGVSELRFKRRYKDHSKIYYVECPKEFDSVITLKLIDVHSNRMGGGCELVRRGRQSLGGKITWD